MPFARFMSTPAGRILRVVAGIALVAVGLATQSVLWGVVLGLVGVVFIVAGAANVCFLAPLLRVPFQGRKLPVE